MLPLLLLVDLLHYSLLENYFGEKISDCNHHKALEKIIWAE